LQRKIPAVELAASKGNMEHVQRNLFHQQGMCVTKYSSGDPEMQTIPDFSFDYFLQILNPKL